MKANVVNRARRRTQNAHKIDVKFKCRGYFFILSHCVLSNCNKMSHFCYRFIAEGAFTDEGVRNQEEVIGSLTEVDYVLTTVREKDHRVEGTRLVDSRQRTQ
jgi:hypothetical protein